MAATQVRQRPSALGDGERTRQSAPQRGWPHVSGFSAALHQHLRRTDPFVEFDSDEAPGPEDEGFERLAGAQDDQWPPQEQPAYGVVAPGPDGAWSGDPGDAVEYAEEEIIWFTAPPAMLEQVALGAVHTEAQCPVMIFRVLDEQGDWVELAGSCQGILDLAAWLTKITTGIACMAHGLDGPQPLRGPVIQAKTG